MEKPLFMKPIHPYSYRKERNLPLIIGVVSYAPDGLSERTCFKVQYDDGEIDYVAVQDVLNGNHSLVTEP